MKRLQKIVRLVQESFVKKTPAGTNANIVLEPFTALSSSRSKLLHSVTSEPAQLDVHGSGETPKANETHRTLQRLGIGERLEDAKQKVLKVAKALLPLVDGQTASLLQDRVHKLHRQVSRIAFVGQVNAGKSSLINALSGLTALLPADINPWTTVITNVHFGVPSEPTSGASFTFFTTEEWRRLSVGGKVRELTERIYPDFPWNALNTQVEVMRCRAESKLGLAYQDLLGRTHSYPTLTPGLLNKYVGAGIEGAVESGGDYSEITKVANVYCEHGAFSFPTILIDTPGINDPFLVRDEITRQSLEFADACVVVLTARQPLSDADLGLLRMLRGLKKNRIIIFVNKIDTLDADIQALAEITQQMRGTLQKEFPQSHMPIVLGSALWAQQSIEALDALAHQSDVLNDRAILDEVENNLLFERSGLLALALCISDAMRDSSVMREIDEFARLCECLSQNCREAGTHLVDVLRRISSGEAEAGETADMHDRASESIERVFADFEESAKRFCEQYSARIASSLAGILSEALTEILADLPDDKLFKQLALVDMRLRVRLETVFSSAVQKAMEGFLAEFAAFQSHLIAELKKHGFSQITVALPLRNALDAEVSCIALSEPVGFNVAANQSQVAERPMTAAERRSEVANIIARDFAPIVGKLADEAQSALAKGSADALMTAKALTLWPITAMCERLRQQLSNEPQTGDTPHEIEVTQKKLERFEQLDDELSAVRQAMASIV